MRALTNVPYTFGQRRSCETALAVVFSAGALGALFLQYSQRSAGFFVSISPANRHSSAKYLQMNLPAPTFAKYQPYPGVKPEITLAEPAGGDIANRALANPVDGWGNHDRVASTLRATGVDRNQRPAKAKLTSNSENSMERHASWGPQSAPRETALGSSIVNPRTPASAHIPGQQGETSSTFVSTNSRRADDDPLPTGRAAPPTPADPVVSAVAEDAIVAQSDGSLSFDTKEQLADPDILPANAAEVTRPSTTIQGDVASRQPGDSTNSLANVSTGPAAPPVRGSIIPLGHSATQTSPLPRASGAFAGQAEQPAQTHPLVAVRKDLQLATGDINWQNTSAHRLHAVSRTPAARRTVAPDSALSSRTPTSEGAPALSPAPRPGERTAVPAIAMDLYMSTAVNGKRMGPIPAHLDPLVGISIRLRPLLKLIEPLMDKGDFARLNGSKYADTLVSLDMLRAAGIAVNYDSDRSMLSFGRN